jgi:hypothetical protein
MAGRIALGANGSKPVAAGESAVLTGIVYDDADNALPAVSLTSLTLSLVDTATGAIINSVSAVNILNADRGAVDGAGNLSVLLGPADTALSAGVTEAERSMVFVFTWGSPLRTAKTQVDFKIKALSA